VGTVATGIAAATPTPRTATITGGPWENIVKIRLTVDGQTATVTLNDTPTARDFVSLPPLTLDMHDPSAGKSPDSYPRPLTLGESGDIPGGDLGYWAPSDDLAISHADDGKRIPSPGIVIIGRDGLRH
jgi:hypothetical protein